MILRIVKYYRVLGFFFLVDFGLCKILVMSMIGLLLEKLLIEYV